MADNAMNELIAALKEQTDAINRLIHTNAALMQALVEDMDSGEEQPTTYLSGKKV